ncbi:MAG TPA: hypothetical protein VLB44_20360 [Kofleriaceae bacterium]|nr:hypothetical protein [Kofleriaceae bacterium]
MPGQSSGTIEVAGLTIHRDVVQHPLLGDAHVIESRGRLLTHMSAIDWDRPTQIPTVAAPAALPPGTGSQLINLIAELAVRAGVPTLRYAGPYPTAAIFKTLLYSFRTTADEDTFTKHALDRATRVARDEIPIDFIPAPHRRVEHAHGASMVRDGLERTRIGGTQYERDGSPGRLVAEPDGGGWAAEIWFGDSSWARVALLDAEGHLVDGPHPIPPATSSVLGQTFSQQLAAALGELVVDFVPVPMAKAAHQLLTSHPIVWADLGARPARYTDGRFEVHVALWERIAPLGMSRLALALVEALAPVITSTLAEALLKSPSSRPLP